MSNKPGNHTMGIVTILRTCLKTQTPVGRGSCRAAGDRGKIGTGAARREPRPTLRNVLKHRLSGGLVLIGFALVSAGIAAQAETNKVILDTSGFWRFHLTLRTPVVSSTQGLATVGAKCDTLPPDPGWAAPGFDDSGWVRVSGAPFASWSHWEKVAAANVGFIYCHHSSLALAQLCLRGRFLVEDPAQAGALKLSVKYRGGVAVYVNGQELTRQHLPKTGSLSADTPAEMYPPEAYYTEEGFLPKGYGGKGSDSPRLQLHLRDLEVEIPAALLRKGTNVLALSLHRSPLPRDVFDKLKPMKEDRLYCTWDACGLYSARLESSASATVGANARRPARLQGWNSSVLATDTDLDWGDPLEPLQPIRIVGTRNGSFSGKLLVGCDEELKELKASVTALAGPGNAVIPASAITLRFAVPDLPRGPAHANRLDSLAERPPTVAPVRRKEPRGNWVRILPGEPAPVYGAVAAVWATVRVPAEAQPGTYRGTLTVGASGGERKAPLEVEVAGFTLPEPRDDHTFVELVQSPDTLALEYGVPLWSGAHWRLIEKSLSLTAQVGARTCYIPLISGSNLGNEQSMVRWVKQGGTHYGHDFSVMERYLDLVAKHLGKSTLVCVYAWDNFLEGGQFSGDLKYEPKTTREDRLAYQGKGPEVTLLDGARVGKLALPQYSEPEAKPLWEGLARELLARMKQRGLETNLLLGLATDATPAPAVVEFWKDLMPGVPWASHAHSFRDKIQGVPVAYASAVWPPRFIPYEGPSRLGWKNPRLMTQFARDVTELNPLTVFRLIGEHNVGGDQRGFARFGADFWPVIRNAKGEWTARVCEAYPKANWRNLNIKCALLGPGPDGPVATARFELLREGLQECEARIALEQALGEGKLSPDLAARCKEVIAERNHAIVMGLSPHTSEGFLAATDGSRTHDWQGSGNVGYYWFLTSGWQERSRRLFETAGAVTVEAQGDRTR
jgi:hypothetical protein